MKIGFSSITCPEWDLEKIVSAASAMGYDGVELCGLGGERHLPLAPKLARDPDGVRQMLAASSIELVCLAACATLSSTRRGEVADRKASIIEYIELAARLGCPRVRIGVGLLERVDHRGAALSRIADGLASLAPIASRFDVTLLIENGDDFPSSQDLWFLVDSVSHPAVKGCWAQSNALIVRERASLSIPRLGSKIELIHVSDAELDTNGVSLQCKPLGEGRAEIARQVELLRGLAYEGYLIFAPDPAIRGARPQTEDDLAHAAKYLRECVDAKQDVLSAYKGDKNAPKLAARAAIAVET